MVIRSSYYPRLPRFYWGELIYATPGCGKTYVSNKYRDVVDGDELIVDAIREEYPEFYFDEDYKDPRHVIFKFFRYIHFNSRDKWTVYNNALRKMRNACSDEDVVLFGTVDLINEADRIFLEQDNYYVRNGFNVDREREEAADVNANIHLIHEYLDNSLQKVCKRRY